MTLPPYDPPVRPPVLPRTDLSYAVEHTVVGRLLLAVDTDGVLLTCAYAATPALQDRWLQRLADTVSPRVLHRPADTDEARRALTAYLSGEQRTVALKSALTLATAFQRQVLTALEGIGYGEQASYGALADTIGAPRAARAVGTALGGNPLCIVRPCHRIVPASGGTGGYAGGPEAKAYLLDLEARGRPQP